MLIPCNAELSKYRVKIKSEIASSKSIKSAQTRKLVGKALGGVLTHLVGNGKAPDNGLVICCGFVEKFGNVSEGFSPDVPVTRSNYHCGDHFLVDGLKKTAKHTYGYVIFDGSGCVLAKVRGTKIDVVLKKSVDLPNKHNKGGQSQNRFLHGREEKRLWWRREVEEHCIEKFIENNLCSVKGVVIAGCGKFKNELILDKRIPILGIFDVGYGGRNGLFQAIKMSASCLDNAQLEEQRQLLASFFSDLNTQSDLVGFGRREIEQLSEAGAIKQLILSEAVAKEYKDVVEQVQESGGRVSRVGAHFPQAQMFARGFGGVGAILRYSKSFVVSYETWEDDESSEDSSEFF